MIVASGSKSDLIGTLGVEKKKMCLVPTFKNNQEGWRGKETLEFLR